MAQLEAQDLAQAVVDYFRQIFQKIRKKKDVLFWNGGQIAD